MYTAWQIDRGRSHMLEHALPDLIHVYTTTKFMVVVTSVFNLVISSFPDSMFYHVWTWLLIYHDGSNNVVQVCSFIKPIEQSVPTCMNKPVNDTVCSSWPVQPCSSQFQQETSYAILIYKYILHVSNKLNLKLNILM